MKTRMLVAAVVLLIAASGRAEIVGTGGAAVEIAPPPSVDLDALESDTEVRTFEELQVVTLGAPLVVNISAPGVYDDAADVTPATIPAATVISSHLVHFDIVFQGAPGAATGSVTFRDRILGVIVDDADLDATDFLGAPGTTYPQPGIQFRGFELFELDRSRSAATPSGPSSKRSKCSTTSA